MYSSSRSATHHIFFPPRLQVVVEQQNADRLPSYRWHQLSFDRFFAHKPNRPPRVPLRRLAANHRDNALFLAGVQDLRRAWAWLLVERLGQSAALVAMRESPDHLRRQRDGLSDLG